jgi:hypothetical protein
LDKRDKSSSSELGVWKKRPFDDGFRLPVGNGRFRLTDKMASVVSKRALSNLEYLKALQAHTSRHLRSVINLIINLIVQ